MTKLTCRLLCVLLLCALLLSSSATTFASDSLVYTTQSVSTSGGAKTVNVVWADLNNSSIQVQPVISTGGLHTTTALATMAESVRTSDVIELAAINGSFFEAYSGTNVIYGPVQINGQYIKTGGSEVVMGINSSNKVIMGDPRFDMRIYLENTRGTPDEKWWNVWCYNYTFQHYEEVAVFNSSFGSYTPSTSTTSVVVRNGVVTEITSGAGPIYNDGFTIASSGGRQMTSFSVGDNLTFQISQDSAWDGYDTKIPGGPILVDNGVIRTDYAEQGYTEAKVTSNSATRSFVGVTAENKLFVGTVSSATTAQLAEIAKNMGAVYAMNLDGGASTSLYYGGSYKVSPGRNLASSLVITDTSGSAMAAPPATSVGSTGTAGSGSAGNSGVSASEKITVTYKGTPITFDQEPIKVNNRVLVPMRAIFEILGAEVDWNPTTQTVTGTLGSDVVTLTIGSNTAYLNGSAITLDAAPQLTGGYTMVPTRFIAESLNAEVDWESSSNTVVIAGN